MSVTLEAPPDSGRYPYYYAAGVIDSFIDKRGRVTNFIAKVCAIDPRKFRMKLIHLFMYKNGAWQVVREMLKRVDDHDLYDEIAALPFRERLKYLTYVKHEVTDFMLDNEE